MKISELEIGACYSRGDDAEYMIIYITDNWFTVFHHSYNHNCVNCEIYPKEWLDEDYNKNLRKLDKSNWPLSEYINDFKLVDTDYLKYEG